MINSLRNTRVTQKRKRNVVIKNIKESNFKDRKDRIAEDLESVWEVVGQIVVDRDDIWKVTRVGTRPEQGKSTEGAKPRPVIIEMATPHAASELCMYGSGRRIYFKDTKEEYWVNAHRIQADRDADYRAREEARKQKRIRDEKFKAAREAEEAKKMPIHLRNVN